MHPTMRSRSLAHHLAALLGSLCVCTHFAWAQQQTSDPKIISQELLNIYNGDQQADTSQAIGKTNNKNQCMIAFSQSMKVFAQEWHAYYVTYQKNNDANAFVDAGKQMAGRYNGAMSRLSTCERAPIPLSPTGNYCLDHNC